MVLRRSSVVRDESGVMGLTEGYKVEVDTVKGPWLDGGKGPD